MRSNYDLQVDIGRQIFLEYDQTRLIQKYGLQADSQWIYLDYLHTPCRISRTTGQIEERGDSVWTECRNFSTVMTIYDLLCYNQDPTAPQLAHQWCAVGGFVITGVQDTGRFTSKYAARFNGHLQQLRAACEHTGGILQPTMAGADLTCLFPVTPFFPVLLQFWEGDEEFPPKLMVMWDKHANRFLHFETTFYLQGDLLERLASRLAN